MVFWIQELYFQIEACLQAVKAPTGGIVGHVMCLDGIRTAQLQKLGTHIRDFLLLQHLIYLICIS